MDVKIEDIINLDLYEIIGCSRSASEAEIKKAYRKKALTCHPDKNPDNPKAKELFLQLSRILEVLTDTAAKAAYDRVIIAREEAKKRVKQLDSKRRKFKEDLEAREEAYRNSTAAHQSNLDEIRLKAEIERLKKEGSRLVEQEQEYLRKKLLEELQNAKEACKKGTETQCRVKIRWKVRPDDKNNGGYNEDNLHKFFSKYGDITALVILKEKKGRGLVEFANREAAESAVSYELGLYDNPLKLEGMWANKTSKSKPNINNLTNCGTGINLFPSADCYESSSTNNKQKLSFSSAPDIFARQSDPADTNFESIVLNNLKRAEERRKLIEQMQEEDKAA